MKTLTKRLGQWRRLRREDKAIWAEAAILLCLVRAALWIVPFKTLRRFAVREMPAAHSQLEDVNGVRALCTGAVRSLARFVPRATCLTQSLVVLIMLRRRSDPVVLQIGVAKGENGRLKAHAWIETPERRSLTPSGEGFTPLLQV